MSRTKCGARLSNLGATSSKKGIVMLAADDKNRLQTIISNTVGGNRRWLSQQNIGIGDKGNYFVLNYGPGQRNDFDRLVRGMVIRKPNGEVADLLSLIVSFPFVRFHNQHEKEAAPVDFQNAQMIEKLDGTMVGAFFDGDDVRWHTRKMISTHQPDLELTVPGSSGGTWQFLKLVGEFVGQMNWVGADRNLTYVFEFIHESTTGRTEYRPEQYGLYLIGSRNVKTHREYDERELNELAGKLEAPRPRLWDAVADEEAILEMMQDIRMGTPGFEGFVFRDRRTGARIKVKDPDYVKWCHMLNEISYKRLVPLYLKGEAEEVVAYFPAARERIGQIEQKVHAYLDTVVGLCRHWRDRANNDGLNRKRLNVEVSAEHKDKFLVRQIMKHFEQDKDDAIHQAVKADLWRMGGAETKGAQPKRFMDLVGLADNAEHAVVPNDL